MIAQLDIIDKISDLCDISKISLLSSDSDYAMSFVGGKNVKKYKNGDSVECMNVQLIGKDKDQTVTATKLCDICNFVTRLKHLKLPKGDEWEVQKVSVASPPAPKVFKDGMWFYTCILSVNYLFKPRKDVTT